MIEDLKKFPFHFILITLLIIGYGVMFIYMQDNPYLLIVTLSLSALVIYHILKGFFIKNDNHSKKKTWFLISLLPISFYLYGSDSKETEKKENIEILEKGVVSAQHGLRLRDIDDVNTIITAIPLNDTISIVEEKGEHYVVLYGDFKGLASKKFIKKIK